ncbi:uncharacterized protein LOC110709582 [Chenopodium quinoa]|uniref:uncharacterized protein LOC110709582 n=1 Tax=Chenopodium quinoa TaxID=63459 RepID=UPI000B7734BC|nr:uncharacterized protein LOC110709582 [Chenopodium quinoa]
MNMELPYAYNKHNNVHVLHGDSSRLFVIIRHSESRVLMKILAQALLLALLIMVLVGVCGGTNAREYDNIVLPSKNNVKLITNNINNNKNALVFQDLANEGLWKSTKDKSIIVSDTKEQVIEATNKVEFTLTLSPSDTKYKSIHNDTFDFSYTDCFGRAIEGFLDRTLKIGGVMAVQLSRDPAMAFEGPPNYKIVYFRKCNNSTFIAMRKVAYANTMSSRSASQRKLLQFFSEEKKAVLGNLEDVLLEPPRSATGKSKTYLRKTKFLPDLLNDSLEGYSRRVYIDVGGGHGSTRWFEQNYPTRNKDFDMYRIETVPETEVESDDAWEGPPTQMGISDWLWRNVKAEEYVVMKADAEVVEEMLKSKAIALVDELFLECKPIGKGGSSKRAYWECLALYGRLRDFGVAVHQWWG